MNGQWLGRRTIRTNWATRKPGQGGGDQPASNEKTYDDIFNMTTPDNTSVYVGNVAGGVCGAFFLKLGRILSGGIGYCAFVWSSLRFSGGNWEIPVRLAHYLPTRRLVVLPKEALTELRKASV